MDQIFEALADGTRRKIIELLSERAMTAGEIAAVFSMTKPSISHHLKKLTQAGLIVPQKKGRYIIYRQEQEAFRRVMAWLYQAAGNVWIKVE